MDVFQKIIKKILGTKIMAPVFFLLSGDLSPIYKKSGLE